MRKKRLYALMGLCLIVSLLLTACTGDGRLLALLTGEAGRGEVHFSDLPFYLPDIEEVRAVMRDFAAGMEASASAGEQIALIDDYDEALMHYLDMSTIARIRFSQDVSEQTQADREHFTAVFAGLAEDEYAANVAIVASVYIKDLEEYYGEQEIERIREYVRDFDPALYEVAKAISDLQNEYIQLAVNDDDEFALEADSLFTEMLPLRERMAGLAGYDSFCEYMYADWSVSLSDVERYIADVKQTILPVYYTLADGSYGGQGPCPAADWIDYNEWIFSGSMDNIFTRVYDISVRILRASLEEMGPMIDYLERNGMIDAMPRDTKENGAYVIYLYGARTPFAYLEYPEPDWMFHELGHALEFFERPEIEMSESYAETPESLEVASTCMEVLAMGQYEQLYGDTADYARMQKVYYLTASLLEATLQCEFELALYQRPDMTWRDRAVLFNGLLEEYGMDAYLYPWAMVRHYFVSPLYTISYSLDNAVALELWRVQQDDPARAKEMYLNYLRDSAQQDFSKRLKGAGFSSPLERKTLDELARLLDDLFRSDAYQNPGLLQRAG